MSRVAVSASAPGRVVLIGDHTDTTGGWSLTMAIDRRTTVEGERGGDAVVLTSDSAAGRVVVPVADPVPAAGAPHWADYVAGVVAEVRPSVGFTGHVRTTVPLGAGLSSSAALGLALALALGFEGSPTELALAGQRAEHRAGVPVGVLDQLSSASGVAGAALLLDCTTIEVTPVPLPDGVEVVVVPSGIRRSLATSGYAERRRQVEAVEAALGPLRHLTLDDIAALDDAVLARRARHVVTENARVHAVAALLAEGDLEGAGVLMVEGHASLRDDFEVSLPAMDSLVERLTARPGVYGARMTGGGFGGCAVVLADPAAVQEGWAVRAADGARVDTLRGLM